MCFGLQTAMSITMKQSRGQTLLSRYVWQIMQCKVQCDHVNKMANCNNDQIFSFNVICHFMIFKSCTQIAGSTSNYGQVPIQGGN